MDTPPIIEVDLNTFPEVVERSRQVPVVLLFWTEQVAPAAETKGALERLAQQYQGKFVLGLSDIAKDQTLAQQMRVQGIPSIRAIVGGQLAEQMDGPQGEGALRQMIDRLTQSPSDALKSQLERYLELEDFDGALAVLKEAIAAEPNNAGFKVEWADLLLVKGDVDGGRTVLNTIPEGTEDRDRPATRLEMLEEAAGMGELGEALDDISANDADLDARYRASVLLTRERRYEEALDQAMEILRRDREFREDAGRLTMIRIMALMGKGSDVAKRYRRRMFNTLH